MSFSGISNYSKEWASNLGEKLRPALLTKLTGLFKWHGPKNTNILRLASGGGRRFMTKTESICEAQMVILIIGLIAVTFFNLIWPIILTQGKRWQIAFVTVLQLCGRLGKFKKCLSQLLYRIGFAIIYLKKSTIKKECVINQFFNCRIKTR